VGAIIEVDADYLFTHRSDRVEYLLKEFAAEPVVVQIRRGVRSMLLTAGNNFTQHESHERRRFAVWPEMINAAYHEEWVPKLEGRKYVLERVYMNAYLVQDISTVREFAALHCDLNDSEVYKVSPHLHVWIVGEPLRHAHLPLNIGHLKQVTSSVAKLTSAFKGGLKIIRHEIVRRYCEYLASA